MKLRGSHNNSIRAMTLTEVILVLVVVLLLAAIFLPALGRMQRRASRITCINNVKMVGLAYKIWEGDNHDKFPI